MLEDVLANEPRTHVYAIVVPKLADRARAHLETLTKEQRERTAMIDGDVAAMDLGLSGAEFRQLTREIDRIHHIAHASWVGVDDKTAKSLNVVGTAEVIEFARACSSLEQMVHHSTASVSGDRS